MKIKPTKCRSFTLSSGKPSVVHFKFEENVVPSISEEEQKFLGRVLFFSGKSEECYRLLESIITKKMNNLDKTEIRNEYKLEIYQMYILPSIRFLLTVHDLPQTYLTKLDTAADQFLKRWAGLPKCATYQTRHSCRSVSQEVGRVTQVCNKRNITSKHSTQFKENIHPVQRDTLCDLLLNSS